jgi:hypothetical protein
LTNGGYIYLFGDGSSVGVNVNATSWTTTDIAGSNSGTGFEQHATKQFTPSTKSQNVSDFGSFNQTIDSFDGYTHTSDTISFLLTNTGGTWATAESVLAANADGYFVVAHIFVASAPATALNGTDALTTGYAANGSVPDGGVTMSLLGMAMAGLGLVARRKK